MIHPSEPRTVQKVKVNKPGVTPQWFAPFSVVAILKKSKCTLCGQNSLKTTIRKTVGRGRTCRDDIQVGGPWYLGDHAAFEKSMASCGVFCLQNAFKILNGTLRKILKHMYIMSLIHKSSQSPRTSWLKISYWTQAGMGVLARLVVYLNWWVMRREQKLEYGCPDSQSLLISPHCPEWQKKI